MSNQRPSLPKGTRDFGPQQMVQRNYILSVIRQVFEKYGFQPLETPSMENLSVLMGKYGTEGDQLLYKVLNSGDFLKKVLPNEIQEGSKSILPKIAEKGLRYDLTVPFARYVVMHQHEIAMPFKRYQIQPVWRADRPQKGRYREFLQCDADVVGTESVLCEAEVIAMITEIFSMLGIDGITVKVNHRGILSTLAGLAGNPEAEAAFYTALDKLDKIGIDKVKEELIGAGFEAKKIDSVFSLIAIDGTNDQRLLQLSEQLTKEGASTNAIDELGTVLEMSDAMNTSSLIKVDFSLARGLSYYTGTIIEVTVDDGSMGSLSGGGRYDNLTGVFGLQDVPGIGFSLGVDRIYDVMLARDLFDGQSFNTTKILLTPMDEKTFLHALPLLSQLRSASISSELYPEPAKIKKQLTYANKKGIPFVLLVGSEEMNSGKYTLKTMESGEQESLTIDQLIKRFSNE